MVSEVIGTPATIKQAEQLGLLPEEFEKVISILKRTPNFTELSIFSVMWSEHCSYKNSISWLKKLPRKGKNLLAEAGEENAGLMDIGDGLACAFKVESHNHPSAIEPYQGAATGVGGIHRDIFTMGARPVASLNSLRFGNLESEHSRWHLRGVVKGIGDYGNSFGVPTVAGEIYFNDCYNINPLVNAMSVGIVEHGRTVSAISEGVGNPIYIVGSLTGKDGIHGATFASVEITEDSAEKLPSVQVGDPFQEKKLLEATMEAIATGALVGMQDMGAAGITCSTTEMSAKGKHGMIIHLEQVPLRQENMQPFEILLSESQERMLMVIKKGREKELETIFEKWDLSYSNIGAVTKGDRCKYFMHDELVADVPADDLVLGGGAPVYQREMKEPSYLAEIKKFDSTKIPQPEIFVEVAEKLVANPNIASKRWVTQQYDSMVQIGNMVTNSPADAALIRIKGTNRALALTIDCNSSYVFADPQKGCAIAVAEAARNITCAGGRPLGVTNCLNFGNPYNKEVFWQFANSIMGMKDACEKFETPVTGGNVSFYNQSSDEGPVFPTPVIGMLGLVDDVSKRMSLDFKNAGDLIYMIGEASDDIASSEYLKTIHNVKYSPAPYFNLDEEYKMQKSVYQLIQESLIQSAHDLSEGGLFITLLESSMPRNFGFSIQLKDKFLGMRLDGLLFGEAQGRVIVSVKPEDKNAFENAILKSGVAFSFLGLVANSSVEVDSENFGSKDKWKNIYDNALESIISAG